MNPSHTTSPSQRSGRRTLLLIAAICLLPLLAAVVLRLVWTPPKPDSLGELLPPQALAYDRLVGADGRPWPHEQVADRWLIVYASPGQCDAACQETLYLTRQSRTAQGKASLRLGRLWVLTDDTQPDPALLAAHPDLQWAKLVQPGDLPELGGVKQAPRHLFLVDRRGQIVMRYSDHPEPMAFIKELGRLIKF
ncbi:hypothetical protein [Ideonella alba]|uniref:Thioredoxin domain-containing protein n=1 Tax=Ideonella alba TaxID=2824118 RepID=A0A941BGE2_9BURK|nr:hypothetical protein [Ideonella alba]MBQ0930438.1 hypothetical protein [Ideonella alba]